MKKATHQDLADHLGRAKSTVSKYPREKLKLMLLGLAALKAGLHERQKQNDTRGK